MKCIFSYRMALFFGVLFLVSFRWLPDWPRVTITQVISVEMPKPLVADKKVQKGHQQFVLKMDSGVTFSVHVVDYNQMPLGLGHSFFAHLSEVELAELFRDRYKEKGLYIVQEQTGIYETKPYCEFLLQENKTKSFIQIRSLNTGKELITLSYKGDTANLSSQRFFSSLRF